MWNSAKDSGKFGLSTLIVNVTDVNEPPYFTEPTCLNATSSCQYTIEENKFVEVVQVKALDPDIPQCLLTYKIGSLDKQYFDIDAKSGNITTKKAGLDREIKPHYQIDVEVLDCEEPTLYEKKKILFTITDENDNFPIFSQNYTKYIREDRKINSSLLKVTATGKKR